VKNHFDISIINESYILNSKEEHIFSIISLDVVLNNFYYNTA